MKQLERNTPIMALFCFSISFCIWIFIQNEASAFTLYLIMLILNMLYWLEPSNSIAKIGFGLNLLCFATWLLLDFYNANVAMKNNGSLALVAITCVGIWTKHIYSFVADLAAFQPLPKKLRARLNQVCFYCNVFAIFFTTGVLICTIHPTLCRITKVSSLLQATKLAFCLFCTANLSMMIAGFMLEAKKYEGKY